MRSVRAIVLGAFAAVAIAACDALPFPPVGHESGAQVVCEGVPRAACQLSVDSLGRSADRPVRIVVRCTVPVCTEEEGDAELTIQFADGRSVVSGHGWTTDLELVPVQEPPVTEGS